MGINPLSALPGLSGAGNYASSKPENQTTAYLQLVQQAGGDDGKLSKDELKSEIDKLKTQQTLINQVVDTFGDFFGGQAKIFLNAIKKQVDTQLKVANTLNDNFDTFDKADTSDGLISKLDVVKLASKDGNVYDISNHDLGLPVETPQEIGFYYRFFKLADTDGGLLPGQADNKLTKDEIDSGIKKINDQISSLQEIQDIYPGSIGNAISQQIDDLQRVANAGARMKANFDSLDAANTDNKTDGSITILELFKAANRDGDYTNLSDKDLIRPATT